MKKAVRFTYARVDDATNKLVKINDVVEMGQETRFFCPNCNGEMIRRCGEKNAWHFAHKRAECQHDKYLHTIAEIMIQEWFNSSEEVNIEFENNLICPKKNECIFFYKERPEPEEGYHLNNREYCKKKINETYNLKKWFDNCKAEKEFITEDGKRFVADLLCPNKKSPEKPLFLEICVTKPCSQEKIDSGIRIIEFVIKSEDDLDALIGSTIKQTRSIHLYNFHIQERNAERIEDVNMRELIKAAVKLNWHDRKIEHCYCNKLNERKWDIEVTVDFTNEFLISSAFGYIASLNSQYYDCEFCQSKWETKKTEGHYFERVCRWSNYRNKPYNNRNFDPARCHRYIRDEEGIKQEAKSFAYYMKDSPIDVWVRSDEENRQKLD